MTRRATFTKAEITRAVSAIKATELHIVRVEITADGKILIETGTPKNAGPRSPAEQLSPLEQWQAEHAE